MIDLLRRSFGSDHTTFGSVIIRTGKVIAALDAEQLAFTRFEAF